MVALYHIHIFSFMGISLIRFFYVPIVNYHFLYYRIHHNILEVKSTFFFKRQDITKVERLQFLQIRTNPLAKLFKINEISFVSAGHSIELPFVSEKEAEYIEDQIFSQLRELNMMFSPQKLHPISYISGLIEAFKQNIIVIIVFLVLTLKTLILLIFVSILYRQCCLYFS